MSNSKSRFRMAIVILKQLLLLTALLLSVEAPADELHNLVSQRLAYMKQVAAYKWQHQLPIENLEREDVVLSSAIEKGLQYGVTINSSREFFSQQIAAAKEIQHYWFEQWRLHPHSSPQNLVNLEHQIRPALLLLGDHIAAVLAGNKTNLASLDIEGLGPARARHLNEAAHAVKLYPDQLSQIRDSGILRVGTTGDYAPFSYRPDSDPAPWTGIDIDLAKNLAHFLGVQIQWVQTTWPTLMDDLHRGKYDIGMSGISINMSRQKTAFFSTAYHRGGKVPIIRCSDTDKYASLQQIDQPGTRVIVNPGGTNQKFVNANIRQAAIILHNDNRSIFNEIIAQRADVMITDLIEVKLQVSRHPELCAAITGSTLTVSEKGFLLPQDKAWKSAVDAWLEISMRQGSVEELFTQHLSR